MLSLDEHIARSLQESLENGELRRAKNWGKPLESSQGMEETPEEFRLAFKMLKNAGYIPPEVENIRSLAALRTELETTPESDPNHALLRSKIAQLQTSIAVRIEAMRSSGG
jgi:hypothetical protein